MSSNASFLGSFQDVGIILRNYHSRSSVVKPGFHMIAPIVPIAHQKGGTTGAILVIRLFPYDRKDPDRRDRSQISLSIDRWHLRYFAVFDANLKMPAINRRLVLAVHLFIILAALRRRRAFQESTISRPSVLVLFFCFSGGKPNLPPISFQSCSCPYTPC